MAKKSECLAQVLSTAVESITNHSGSMVLLYDMEERLLYASPSFEKLTGYKVAGLRKKKFTDYIHPDDQNDLKQSWKRLFQGKAYQGEYRLITKKRNVKLFLAFWKPVYDAGKRQIGVLLKEEIIPDSDTLQTKTGGEAEILDQLNIPCFELDMKGRFTFINDALCRQTKYSRDDLLRMNFRAFFKSGRKASIQKFFEEIRRTGQPKIIPDFKMMTRTGSAVSMEPFLSVRRNGSGKIVGFQGVIANIAGKVTSEEYGHILEMLGEGFLENDLKGNYTFFNDAYCKLLGYSRGELMGVNYKQIHPLQIAQHLKQIYRGVYETGKPELLHDIEIIRKDGSTAILQINVALILDDSGNPIGFRNLLRDITERKKAEESLKKSEEKYRTILETMEDGYAEYDLKGKLLYVNKAACLQGGYSADELYKIDYRKIFSPETAIRIQEVYHKIYRTGKPEYLMDYEIIRKDGAIRTHQSNIALMRDASDKPIGFRSISRDITERKKTEEALRESEEKYRTILETMEEGLFELDLKGNYTFLNEAAGWMMGCKPEEMTGKNYRMNHRPETIQYLKEAFRRMYKTGKAEKMLSYDTIIRDGSVRVHEANTTFVRNEAGGIVGFQSLVRDVTEAKKAEEALRRSEERYRTILETMGEGYAEYDLKGNVIFVNDASCKLSGYERDEMIGLNYRNYHNPPVAKYLKEVFHQIYLTGKPEFLVEDEVVRKDGSVRYCQMNVVLMRDALGEPQGFRMLVHDMTEHKKAEEQKIKVEEQLLQAQKMESVGRLAGGVAHDFNNMITVILGYAELIKSKLSAENPILKDLLEIEKAAIRSRDITKQLLAFSRKAIIAPKTVDLNGMIADTQKTILRLIGEDINLRFFPGERLWNIKVDPSQMEHIIINLAVNARDAMPHGGNLTIETENLLLNDAYCKTHTGLTPGQYVMIAVSDEGIGMDSDTLRHVFEPFFTTKEMGKGTGLGLAMVYGIIRQSNGSINVYSEPGSGTTFKIFLPRSADEAIEQEFVEEAPTSGTGTILLVEDDDLVRNMTADMLKTIGYEILTTGNPMEALSLIEKADTPHIDLVITDVVMPGMSGRELGEKIEAIRPQTNILFMSGYTSNVIVHQGVLDEGVNFISKPFSMNDLARKIHRMIK